MLLTSSKKKLYISYQLVNNLKIRTFITPYTQLRYHNNGTKDTNSNSTKGPSNNVKSPLKEPIIAASISRKSLANNFFNKVPESPPINSAKRDSQSIYNNKADLPSYSTFGSGFEHIADSTKESSTNESSYSLFMDNPRVLVKYLDDYVIGQERAKKVLSVAVFNHYSRVRANLRRRAQTKKANSANDHSEMSISERNIIANQRVALPVTTPSTFQYHHLKRNWINPNTSGNPSDPIEFEEEKCQSVHNTTICEKSNVLLLGPTGSGKTLLVKTLAKALKVPFSMSDATTFTQAGYVGEDVELVIQRLLQNCDYDVTRAEQGIVFIDEIDKIARRPDTLSVSKDVSGEGVQQALLKMLEGTTVTITDKGGASSVRKGSASSSNSVKGDVFTVDTSNILFILSGAFIGLDKLITNRISKSSIGFDAPIKSKSSSKSNDSSSEKLKLVEPTDLVKFGLIPEFIGRLPIIATVSQLSQDALVRALTEPRNSLIKQYQALFALNDIDIRFSQNALHTIAKEALENETGARGLRRIMENLLLEPMYETPGSSIRHIVVTISKEDSSLKWHYFTQDQEVEAIQLCSQDDLNFESSSSKSEESAQRAMSV